jgi:hypothetical protein
VEDLPGHLEQQHGAQVGEIEARPSIYLTPDPRPTFTQPVPTPRDPMGVPDSLRTSLGDRYLLEGELGQGGMATVYLAEDLKHRRKSDGDAGDRVFAVAVPPGEASGALTCVSLGRVGHPDDPCH